MSLDDHLDSIADLDSVSYWLDQPEDNNRPQQSKVCQSDCGDVLKRFFTKRLIKIFVLSGTYIGIDYADFGKLCKSCKSSVYRWYFNAVFAEEPKIPMHIFELEIEESNAAADWDMANNEYQRMISDYHENDDTIITKEELDEMKECCQGHKRDWKDVYSRLQMKLKQVKSGKSVAKVKSKNKARNKSPKIRGSDILHE